MILYLLLLIAGISSSICLLFVDAESTELLEGKFKDHSPRFACFLLMPEADLMFLQL